MCPGKPELIQIDQKNKLADANPAPLLHHERTVSFRDMFEHVDGDKRVESIVR
jgi:hypothetical protein